MGWGVLLVVVVATEELRESHLSSIDCFRFAGMEVAVAVTGSDKSLLFNLVVMEGI